MTIGEKLKSLRKQNRMTLEDVANYINVGRATVLKYENGMITNIPSANRVTSEPADHCLPDRDVITQKETAFRRSFF